VVTGEELVDAPADTGGIVSPEKFAQYCMKRRSIRHYKKEPVERDKIEQLLNIARYAPTGGNRQMIEWVVLYSKDTVYNAARLTIDWMRQVVVQNPEIAVRMGMPNLIAGWDAQVDTICRSAPHCIIVHAHKDDLMAPTDGVIALSHLELAAPSIGLGACWAGYMNRAVNVFPPFKAAVGIPEDHIALGVVMVGYPAITYTGIPKRKAASVLWK
jgi:nitroreductase